VAGNIYCHLMAAFSELADVRRAAEWTEATGRWLAGLPAAVLFTGILRYIREWLGAMVTGGGIVDYDPALRTYRLPAEHAACLTRGGSANRAPISRLGTHLAKHVDAVTRAFREGGGVPYVAYRPSSPT
jgi:hypothetical protein